MKLTDNFNKVEFESRDGSTMPPEVLYNVYQLASNLQKIRKEIGASIHINSGYRSIEHNRNIGGVKGSYHTKGMAADITVRGYSPKKLFKVISKLIKQGKIKQGGLGLYNGFVHYDIRGYSARWNNSNKYIYLK